MADVLQIRTSSNLQSARLFGADGRLVREWGGAAITAGLDVSDLAQGSYLLRLSTSDLRLETVQLIK